MKTPPQEAPVVTETDHRKPCRRCPETATELALWRGEELCMKCFEKAMKAEKLLGGSAQ